MTTPPTGTPPVSALQISEAFNAERPPGKHVTPTEEQIAVIESPLVPTLVVAGAGSGKTMTMADRVVWLVVNGIAQPEQILGLTFTRKAARELAERVRSRLGTARRARLLKADPGALTVATYNSFAASVVRDHALRIGENPEAALVTRAGSWQVMDEIVNSWKGELHLEVGASTVTNRALELAEQLQSHLVGVDEARAGIRELLREVERVRGGKTTKTVTKRATGVAEVLRERLELLEIIEEFFARRRERDLVDFSGQVAIACRIAAEVPAVAALMRSQYRVVLLDEFQDTSIAQLRFLVDLFGPGFPAMAVGDPNQAIYGFRGASASSLVSFQEMFSVEDRPVVVRHLTTSWRNDEAILTAANAISSALTEDPTGAGELLQPLGARPGAGAGTVNLSITRTEQESAAEIARWVGQRWERGASSAAVLCRAGAQFPSLVRAFRDRGIEPEVVGLTGLLATPEITDLRAALEVASDATRGDAMMRLLTNERLGLADLRVLREWAALLAGQEDRDDEQVSASIVEAVASPPPAGFRTRGGLSLSEVGRSRVERLEGALRLIRASLSLPVPEIVAVAERALLLDIELASRAGADPTLARGNLEQFAQHAATYADGMPNPGLGGFLSWLAAAESNERGLELAPVTITTGAPQILTAHAAKGLEWDVVAIAGMSEGRFPSRRLRSSKDSPDGLSQGDDGWLRDATKLPNPLRGDAAYLPVLETGAETNEDFDEAIQCFREATFNHGIMEERRLAYVAVTRARHDLLLATSWFRDGPTGPVRLSRFVEELQRVRGLVTVPRGFSVAPPPEPGEEQAVAADGPAPTYPGTDPVESEGPAASRRARLSSAARVVRESGSRLGDVTLASLAEVDAVLAGAVGTGPLTPAARQRVADVRALLRESIESGLAEVELPRHMSASAVVALARDPEEYARSLRRPLPHRPSEAAQVGTAFHAWVERNYGLTGFSFDDGSGLLDEEGPGRPAALAALQATFLDSPWASRRPTAVEVDLETRVAGQIVRCRIDAVFEDGAGVDVVDWKTGSEPRGATETDRRRLQLEIYRLAYARHAGIPLADVRAHFHYVATGVTRVSGMWTEAEIEDRVLRAREAAEGS